VSSILFSDLSQVIYNLWSGFHLNGIPIPAYKSGHVPDHAKPPFITFSVSMGNLGDVTNQTAFLWLRHTPGSNVNRDRAAVADQIASAIPTRGKAIAAANGGGVWISRSGLFLSDNDPEATDPKPDEEPIIGLRVSYSTKTY